MTKQRHKQMNNKINNSAVTKVVTTLKKSTVLLICFLSVNSYNVSAQLVLTKANCEKSLINNVAQKREQKYTTQRVVEKLNDSNVYDVSAKRELISHWNHVATYPQEYPQVKPYHAKQYGLTYSAQSPCYQPNSLATTLVKKIANWQRQHGNGLEFDLTNSNSTFASVDSLHLRLKLNSQHSQLPNNSDVKSTLAPYISDEILTELDDENGYLRFTFYGRNHADNDVATIYGDIIIRLSPIEHGDHWLNISIPFSDLSYSSQINYQEQPVTAEQLAQEPIKGLLITAETKNGKTLRHYLLDDFPENAPEIIKEAAIEIEQILITGI